MSSDTSHTEEQNGVEHSNGKLEANGHANGEHKPTAETPVTSVSLEAEFLREEIKRNQNHTKRTLWYGAVAVVALCLYLKWIYVSLNDTILDSDSLGVILNDYVANSAPDSISALENDLIKRAPMVSEQVVSSVKEFVPLLTANAKAQVDEILTVLPALRHDLTEIIHAYASSHREELRTFAEAHTDQEFVKYFMNDLKNEIVRNLDRGIRRESKGKFKDVSNLSLNQLSSFNNYVQYLHSTNRYHLSRKDVLARRTIATWIEFVHEFMGDF